LFGHFQSNAPADPLPCPGYNGFLVFQVHRGNLKNWISPTPEERLWNIIDPILLDMEAFTINGKSQKYGNK
jgi:hypothetical protein